MTPHFSTRAPAALDGTPAHDFGAVLRHHGLLPQPPDASTFDIRHPSFVIPHATTILAFKFADGVLVAGDRRATAGNTIM